MTHDALTEAPARDAATGDVHVVAGRYEVRRVLGRGGMGVVYEAENTWTHRRVALKVLDPERTADPLQVERFMREARATTALRHPNVVDVLDMGQDPADGALYIVQELLVGEDLRALLEREKTLDEARVRAIMAPVLRGLGAAHAAGIVHRDVKPANLFLSTGPDGELVPKVIDFGIARDVARDVARTGTGEAIGTPAYMAPEQLRAERALTPAVDVWALGVVLYELLSGATPFPANNYNVLVHRVLAGERPPLATALAHVSPAMRAVIDRALDPDVSRRFASASAMLSALDAGYADTQPARRAEPAPVPPKPRRLALALFIAAFVSMALLVAVRASLGPEVTAVAPTPARPLIVEPAPASVATVVAPAVERDAAVERPPSHAERPRARPRHAEHAAPAVTAGPPAAPDPAGPALGRPRSRLLTPGGGAYPSQ